MVLIKDKKDVLQFEKYLKRQKSRKFIEQIVTGWRSFRLR